MAEDHLDVAGGNVVVVYLIPLPIAGLWKEKREWVCVQQQNGVRLCLREEKTGPGCVRESCREAGIALLQ